MVDVLWICKETEKALQCVSLYIYDDFAIKGTGSLFDEPNATTPGRACVTDLA